MSFCNDRQGRNDHLIFVKTRRPNKEKLTSIHSQLDTLFLYTFHYILNLVENNADQILVTRCQSTNSTRCLWFLQRTARTSQEWSRSDRGPRTRGTRSSSWRRNSITIGTWRDGDGSRSLIPWYCPSGRLRSGSRTGAWSGRRTTSCRTRRTCAERMPTAKQRHRRRNRRKRRPPDRNWRPATTTAKGRTTTTRRRAGSTLAWSRASLCRTWRMCTRWTPPFRIRTWFIRASKVTRIRWPIFKRSWVIIMWVAWWRVRRGDRWDTSAPEVSALSPQLPVPPGCRRSPRPFRHRPSSPITGSRRCNIRPANRTVRVDYRASLTLLARGSLPFGHKRICKFVLLTMADRVDVSRNFIEGFGLEW